MKTLLLCFAMMAACPLFAQSDFDKSTDKDNGSIIFKGQFGFDELETEPSFAWWSSGVKQYHPDTAIIKKLSAALPAFEIVVVMGTWCEDSQNLVPKLYKTLLEANYPLENLKLYGVDRSKQTKYIEGKLYKIERVPTIILYKNHVETGRIVESVKASIEADLLRLAEGS